MPIKDAISGLYALARQLTGSKRKESRTAEIGRTRTYGGTAIGDSSDGTVTIRYDHANVVSQDGSAFVQVPTGPSVRAGDRVMVTSVNGSGAVSYVPGEGDRQNTAIANANTAASQAQAIAQAVGQHFWADTSGVHVSTDAEDPDGDANVLLNALGMLIRAGSGGSSVNLAQLSQSLVAFYDGLGNNSSNVVASFGASGSEIGYAAGEHVAIDNNSIDIMNGGTVQSTFTGSSVELGKDSVSTGIKMCGNTGWVTASQIGPQSFLSLSAPDGVSLATRTEYPGQSLYAPTLSLEAPYVENGVVMNKSTIDMTADVFAINGTSLTKAQMTAAINGWVKSTGASGDWTWKIYRDGTFDAYCRQANTSSYAMTQSYYGWYFSNAVNDWTITGLSYSKVITVEFMPEFPTLTFAGIKPTNNNANPPTFGCWLMSPNSKTESGRVIVHVYGKI